MAKQNSLAPRPIRSTVRSPAKNSWAAELPYLLSAGHYDGAEMLVRAELQQHPRSVEAHYWMAAIGIAAARKEFDALGWAKKAVLLDPGSADLQFTLGRAFKEAGQLDEAAAAYRRALTLAPRFAEAWVSLGIVRRAQGDLEDAIRCYREAIRLMPELPAAHANLGKALLEQRRLQVEHSEGGQAVSEARIVAAEEHALEALREADRLAPDDATVVANLGKALVARGELDEAAAVLNRALGLAPEREDLCVSLGDCYFRLRELGVAHAIYEQWLAGHPNAVEVPLNLVGLLLEVGKVEEAEKWIRHVTERAPENKGLLQPLGLQALTRGDAAESLEYYRQAAAQVSGEGSWSGYLMSLNYQSEDPVQIATEHRRARDHFGGIAAQKLARFAGFSASAAPRLAATAGAKIRIGFISGDLRQHSVSYFLEKVWTHLDPGRFEIVGYHNSVITDAVSERLQRSASAWIPCLKMGDTALLRRIRSDDLDVLIDLSGHTGGHRLKVVAARPAPLQMTYLGYPTTSGLPEIDYRITDPTIDPPGEPNLSAEQPLRIPGGMFCYNPGLDPESGPPPMQDNGFVTFGSFNNAAKITDRTLMLWSAVLETVPDSRLYVKTSAPAFDRTRARVLAVLDACGIARERLTMIRWSAETRSHLEQYREMDIALDTYPYNGATTTCEALWMGVPVVTLSGATHVSRMGASILKSAGLDQWVAASPAGFVARAVALAADPAGLAEFRSRARSQLAGTALYDGERIGREFGTCIEQAVKSSREQR
jgi:predicted O-linked N-acetylglucosamine transferase (SPINDLY family)